jgi:uncharacterized protein YbcI
MYQTYFSKFLCSTEYKYNNCIWGVSMRKKRQIKECEEALEALIGKKVLNIHFDTEENDCWRFYIETDGGEFVMTFCHDWACPVVEKRSKK